MPIRGIGVDLVEVQRMEDLLARRPGRARRRLFTAGERESCDRRSRPAEGYAARFAAKEAALKALGTGRGKGIGWRDVEVLAGSQGAPALRLMGAAAARLRELGASSSHVSFSHEGGFAVAVVILEG